MVFICFFGKTLGSLWSAKRLNLKSGHIANLSGSLAANSKKKHQQIKASWHQRGMATLLGHVIRTSMKFSIYIEGPRGPPGTRYINRELDRELFNIRSVL